MTTVTPASTNSSSSFICPSPLVYLAPTKELHASYISIYEDCVVPCPNLNYGLAYWNIQKYSLTAVIIFSTIVCGIVLYSHIRDFSKYYIRVMFIAGFFGYSLVLSFYSAFNVQNNEIICANESQYTIREGMCVFQAASLVWCFTWINTWSAILAVDTYLHVSMTLKIGSWNNMKFYYRLIGAIIPTVVTLIPLVNNNLGFDPEGNLPICFYIISENSSYFKYSFIPPYTVLLVITLVYTLLCAWRIHKVLIQSKHYRMYLAPIAASGTVARGSARSPSKMWNRYRNRGAVAAESPNKNDKNHGNHINRRGMIELESSVVSMEYGQNQSNVNSSLWDVESERYESRLDSVDSKRAPSTAISEAPSASSRAQATIHSSSSNPIRSSSTSASNRTYSASNSLLISSYFAWKRPIVSSSQITMSTDSNDSTVSSPWAAHLNATRAQGQSAAVGLGVTGGRDEEDGEGDEPFAAHARSYSNSLFTTDRFSFASNAGRAAQHGQIAPIRNSISSIGSISAPTTATATAAMNPEAIVMGDVNMSAPGLEIIAEEEKQAAVVPPTAADLITQLNATNDSMQANELIEQMLATTESNPMFADMNIDIDDEKLRESVRTDIVRMSSRYNNSDNQQQQVSGVNGGAGDVHGTEGGDHSSGASTGAGAGVANRSSQGTRLSYRPDNDNGNDNGKERQHEHETEDFSTEASPVLVLLLWCRLLLTCCGVLSSNSKSNSIEGSAGPGIDDSQIDDSAMTRSHRVEVLKSLNLVRAIWHFNGRSMMMVITYGISNIIGLPTLILALVVNYNRYVNKNNNFYDCLRNASFASPIQTQDYVNDYASDVCGTVPNHKASYVLVSMLFMIVSLYPVVPYFVFGIAKRTQQRDADAAV